MQTLSDDLSAAQFHLVDTGRRAAIPNSIPQTVYQKHPQPGDRLQRLFAPFQCDVTRRHHDRRKWPSIAMNVQGGKRDQSLPRPAFRDHSGTAVRLPLLGDTHRGDRLGWERLSQQGGKPWRDWIVCIV